MKKDNIEIKWIEVDKTENSAPKHATEAYVCKQ